MPRKKKKLEVVVVVIIINNYAVLIPSVPSNSYIWSDHFFIGLARLVPPCEPVYLSDSLSILYIYCSG
jgi:hypothetical protein